MDYVKTHEHLALFFFLLELLHLPLGSFWFLQTANFPSDKTLRMAYIFILLGPSYIVAIESHDLSNKTKIKKTQLRRTLNVSLELSKI